MTAASGLPNDLITLPEAARRLGIGIDTAKRLVREGQFPGGAALRVGRQVRVSVPRLEHWLHGETFSGRSMTGGRPGGHADSRDGMEERPAAGDRPDTSTSSIAESSEPSLRASA
jgi:excisionase family DNA binding protein